MDASKQTRIIRRCQDQFESESDNGDDYDDEAADILSDFCGDDCRGDTDPSEAEDWLARRDL